MFGVGESLLRRRMLSTSIAQVSTSLAQEDGYRHVFSEKKTGSERNSKRLSVKERFQPPCLDDQPRMKSRILDQESIPSETGGIIAKLSYELAVSD
jgi:hypothetical protein